MPANSVTTPATGTRVVGEASYGFSIEDTYALLFAIPSEGTRLSLPSPGAVGESYEFLDVDGSCASGHPVTLEASAGTTIQGASSVEFTAPFAWARAVWSGTAWALQAAGSTVAEQPSFVWRSGSQPAPNVFQTWPEVQTAIDALNGAPYSLGCDDTNGPLIIPAGTVRIGTGTWTTGGAFIPLVQFADGALVDTTTAVRWIIDGVRVQANGASPIASIVTPPVIILRDNAQLFTTGGRVFVDASNALAAIVVGPTSELGNDTSDVVTGPVEIFVYGDGIITGPALQGSTGTILYTSDANTGGSPPLPIHIPSGWTATLVSLAAQVSYTPTTSANWVAPPPTTSAQALDRMASLLVSLHGGPIP